MCCAVADLFHAAFSAASGSRFPSTDSARQPNGSACTTSRGGARVGGVVGKPRCFRQRRIWVGSQTGASTRRRAPQGQASTPTRNVLRTSSAQEWGTRAIRSPCRFRLAPGRGSARRAAARCRTSGCRRRRRRARRGRRRHGRGVGRRTRRRGRRCRGPGRRAAGLLPTGSGWRGGGKALVSIPAPARLSGSAPIPTASRQLLCRSTFS